MVVPQSRPSRTRKLLGVLDSGYAADFSSTLRRDQTGIASNNLDPDKILSSLKEAIGAGDRSLDSILATITDVAVQMTGATGAALAMWKQGAMVCRARAGTTAPPIGAELSADTGISGECLRTSKIQICSDTEDNALVDAEVCRSLGLRSIVALPIQGWRGVNGILEVFSTTPHVFSEKQIAFLQQLASLAERARASRPHGASALPPKQTSTATPRLSGLLPASDRVGDVVLSFIDARARPLVFGGIGLAAILLIGVVIWLGWRGPEESGSKAHATAPVVAKTADSPLRDKKAPDNDPIWKPNPGGETLFKSGAKPTAGSPITFAAKIDAIPAKSAKPSPLLADLAAKVAIPRTAIESSPKPEPASDDTSPLDSPSVPAPSTTAPASTNASSMDEILLASAPLPALGVPVSQGVSGGQLVRRTAPVYPAQALTLHQQGTVVLTAVVMEDGTVRDVKAVEGPPVFAQAAIDAVKHWRYKPYVLDGKPVKNAIRVNIDFKFPSNTTSR